MSMRALLGALLVCALVEIPFASAQRSQHRIYSNVQYNQEGGDLLGTELESTVKGDRVEGTLKIYQGGCPGPIQIVGTLSGGKVDASGQNDVYGKVEITGTVYGNRLSGLLHLEKGQRPEKIQLKEITNPHC
jgi:hypothetical protein